MVPRLLTESTPAPVNALSRQYISEPLAPQTITGTIKGQIRAAQGLSAAADMNAQMLVKVVSNDGLTERGVLLPLDNSALSSEYVTGVMYENRKFPLASASYALNSVVTQDGDRLVFEIGTNAHNSVGNIFTHTLVFGDNSATDLPEDEATTAANNPWIELSQSILFQGQSTVITPDERTLVVPVESRLLEAPQDDRLFAMPSEERVLPVPEEPRIYEVPHEDRSITIEVAS